MKHLLFIAITAALLCGNHAFAEEAAAKADAALEQKIKTLIIQLGDTEWQKRNDATTELKNIGKPAVPLLQEAQNNSDPEIRTRATDILNAINPPPAPPTPAINARRMVIGENQGGGMVLQIGGGQAQQKSIATRSFTAGEKSYKVIKTTENGVSSLRVEIIAIKDGKEERTVVEADDEKALEKKDPALSKIINENQGVAQMQVMAMMQVGGNVRMGGMVPPPPMNPAAANALDLLDGFGANLRLEANVVRVADIKADSVADKMGLKTGDALVKVNEQPVATLEDAKKTLSNTAEGTPLVIEVVRDGKTITLKR